MSGRRGALVIVHGVGAMGPGRMLRELGGEFAGPIEDVSIEGRAFPHATLARDQKFEAAYECYYADLKPGLGGAFKWLDFLVYPFRLLLVLSQLGADGWRGEPQGVNAPAIFVS